MDLHDLELDPVCPECIDEGHCMDCQGSGREADGFPCVHCDGSGACPVCGRRSQVPDTRQERKADT